MVEMWYMGGSRMVHQRTNDRKTVWIGRFCRFGKCLLDSDMRLLRQVVLGLAHSFEFTII